MLGSDGHWLRGSVIPEAEIPRVAHDFDMFNDCLDGNVQEFLKECSNLSFVDVLIIIKFVIIS